MTGSTLEAFSGYKWQSVDDVGDSWRPKMLSMLEIVNWGLLRNYASTLRQGKSCVILPSIQFGGRHLVRILDFEDSIRWVARLRQREDSVPETVYEASARSMESEHACMELVRERTNIPVPVVFNCNTNRQNLVGTPFMLMECVRGNAGIDIDFSVIPEQYKPQFLRRMAQIHTELSSVLFPKIGSVKRHTDGSYEIGPIPLLGGPFDTASDFLRAWGSTMQFKWSRGDLVERYGDELGGRIAQNVEDFPHKVLELAQNLTISDKDSGPFPLWHPDFGHNNIIVNDNYEVLSVIDWEGAITAPWECFATFPLILQLVPPPMDVPWNYDEDGVPKDERSRMKLEDQKVYIEYVAQAEFKQGLTDQNLSMALETESRAHLGVAMRLFEDSKHGFYCDLLSCIPPR